MKKTLFITLGITAVLILFAVWLYLLIYGTPTKVTEYFTDFSLFGGGATTPVTTIPETTATTTVVDVKKEGLRQLTTRPVVGFSEFIDVANKAIFMRYAEAGTGHIYQINLESGEEVRLSNVTVPNAESAAFSPNGKYVAIRSGFGTKNDIILITLIPGSDATAETLTPRMVEFSWNEDNEIVYTEKDSAGLAGLAMNPTTKLTRSLFTVPFQSATVVWGQSTNTPTYIYPKAASRLLGYLYAVKNGGISRTPIEGLGLTAFANAQSIVETELVGTTPESSIFDKASGKMSNLPIIAIPTKCIFATSRQEIFCGYQLSTSYDEHFPDAWYKGTQSFADQIWSINMRTYAATERVNPTITAGRDIDIMQMDISSDATMLYFINKNDNTLWLYEI